MLGSKPPAAHTTAGCRLPSFGSGVTYAHISPISVRYFTRSSFAAAGGIGGGGLAVLNFTTMRVGNCARALASAPCAGACDRVLPFADVADPVSGFVVGALAVPQAVSTMHTNERGTFIARRGDRSDQSRASCARTRRSAFRPSGRYS